MEGSRSEFHCGMLCICQLAMTCSQGTAARERQCHQRSTDIKILAFINFTTNHCRSYMQTCPTFCLKPPPLPLLTLLLLNSRSFRGASRQKKLEHYSLPSLREQGGVIPPLKLSVPIMLMQDRYDIHKDPHNKPVHCLLA